MLREKTEHVVEPFLQNVWKEVAFGLSNMDTVMTDAESKAVNDFITKQFTPLHANSVSLTFGTQGT